MKSFVAASALITAVTAVPFAARDAMPSCGYPSEALMRLTCNNNGYYVDANGPTEYQEFCPTTGTGCTPDYAIYCSKDGYGAKACSSCQNTGYSPATVSSGGPVSNVTESCGTEAFYRTVCQYYYPEGYPSTAGQICARTYYTDTNHPQGICPDTAVTCSSSNYGGITVGDCQQVSRPTNQITCAAASGSSLMSGSAAASSASGDSTEAGSYSAPSVTGSATWAPSATVSNSAVYVSGSGVASGSGSGKAPATTGPHNSSGALQNIASIAGIAAAALLAL